MNWRQLGHVLNRPSQLPLQNAGPSGGIYAPTIRFHCGLFYIVTTNISHGGNFVVSAADPSGPWSDPVYIKDAEGIDPSLFFDDDGLCYYVGNGNPVNSLYEGHHTIWLQQLDLETMQLTGKKVVLVDGGTDISRQPIWIEGPHLYKIEGFYYLIAAEGGTAEDHSVVVFRSKLAQGPYESYAGNPIISNRDLNPGRLNPITCTGHADLVQTQNGEWWITLLACRPYRPYEDNCYNTGRETFLVPVAWNDEWPVTSDGTGTVDYSYPTPYLPSHPWEDGYGLGTIRWRDDFNSPDLGSQWNMIRTPVEAWYSLDERQSHLRLRLRSERLTGTGNPTFLGTRQRHAAFSATAYMEFNPTDLSDAAGIMVIQNNKTYYAIQCEFTQDRLVLRLLYKSVLDRAVPEILNEASVSSGNIYFRISSTGSRYKFEFAEILDVWNVLASDVDGRVLSTKHAGGFVGAYVGLFGTTEDESRNQYVDFDWFTYSGQNKISSNISAE